MICIPFAISCLNHYQPCLAELYHRCISECGMNGSFSFLISSINTMMCVNWYAYNNGDWAFKSSVIFTFTLNNSK